MERWISSDDWYDEESDNRIASMNDASTYDRETLVEAILDGIKVDLNKQPYYYLDEDDGEET